MLLPLPLFLLPQWQLLTSLAPACPACAPVAPCSAHPRLLRGRCLLPAGAPGKHSAAGAGLHALLRAAGGQRRRPAWRERWCLLSASVACACLSAPAQPLTRMHSPGSCPPPSLQAEDAGQPAGLRAQGRRLRCDMHAAAWCRLVPHTSVASWQPPGVAAGKPLP